MLKERRNPCPSRRACRRLCRVNIVPLSDLWARHQSEHRHLGLALTSQLVIILMTDPEAIWTVWDQAKPAQRRQLLEIAQALVRIAN